MILTACSPVPCPGRTVASLPRYRWMSVDMTCLSMPSPSMNHCRIISGMMAVVERNQRLGKSLQRWLYSELARSVSGCLDELAVSRSRYIPGGLAGQNAPGGKPCGNGQNEGSVCKRTHAVWTLIRHRSKLCSNSESDVQKGWSSVMRKAERIKARRRG